MWRSWSVVINGPLKLCCTDFIPLLYFQGAGTRSGKGTCSCDHGYSGEMCDSCTDGHYEEVKNDTHTICKSMLTNSFYWLSKWNFAMLNFFKAIIYFKMFPLKDAHVWKQWQWINCMIVWLRNFKYNLIFCFDRMRWFL